MCYTKMHTAAMLLTAVGKPESVPTFSAQQQKRKRQRTMLLASDLDCVLELLQSTLARVRQRAELVVAQATMKRSGVEDLGLDFREHERDHAGHIAHARPTWHSSASYGCGDRRRKRIRVAVQHLRPSIPPHKGHEPCSG